MGVIKKQWTGKVLSEPPRPEVVECHEEVSLPLDKSEPRTIHQNLSTVTPSHSSLYLGLRLLSVVVLTERCLCSTTVFVCCFADLLLYVYSHVLVSSLLVTVNSESRVVGRAFSRFETFNIVSICSREFLKVYFDLRVIFVTKFFSSLTFPLFLIR